MRCHGNHSPRPVFSFVFFFLSSLSLRKKPNLQNLHRIPSIVISFCNPITETILHKTHFFSSAKPRTYRSSIRFTCHPSSSALFIITQTRLSLLSTRFFFSLVSPIFFFLVHNASTSFFAASFLRSTPPT